MFKALRQLFEHAKHIPTIATKLESLEESMKTMRNQQADVFKKWNYPRGIEIINNELLETRDVCERKVYEQQETALSAYRGNLQECAVLYDKMLYQAPDKLVNADYYSMTCYIMRLTVLRNFILDELFGDHDIFSFYLKFVKTDELFISLNDIKGIDHDKVFFSNVIQRGPISDEDNSVEVYMTKYDLIITSPGKRFEINLRYRKTILRVLYSIYRNKFIIYHLVA